MDLLPRRYLCFRSALEWALLLTALLLAFPLAAQPRKQPVLGDYLLIDGKVDHGSYTGWRILLDCGLFQGFNLSSILPGLLRAACLTTPRNAQFIRQCGWCIEHGITRFHNRRTPHHGPAGDESGCTGGHRYPRTWPKCLAWIISGTGELAHRRQQL